MVRSRFLYGGDCPSCEATGLGHGDCKCSRCSGRGYLLVEDDEYDPPEPEPWTEEEWDGPMPECEVGGWE